MDAKAIANFRVPIPIHLDISSGHSLPRSYIPEFPSYGVLGFTPEINQDHDVGVRTRLDHCSVSMGQLVMVQIFTQ